jgi:TRAP-type C4-dicarboxylate transport system permease small subunit
VNHFVVIVEKIAGYCIGLLAVITFGEAILRYVFNSHIPDGFIVGQLMQGIAICWGIATATYADRHVTVDVVFAIAPAWMLRVFDVIGYTINLLFLAAFGYAMSFKVYDTYLGGEISSEILMPLWIGYFFAALGIVAAVIVAALRWGQVVFGRQQPKVSGHV